MTGLKVVVPPSSPTPPTTTTTTTIHSKNAKTNHLDQLTRLNIETDTATSTSCSSATTSSPRPALRGKVLLSPSPMTTDRGFFDSSSTHFAFHSSITTTARSSALRHHLMYQELNGEARGDALPEINTNSYMDSSYRSLSTSSPSASCLSSSPSSLVTPDGQLLKLVRNPNGNELYYTLASPTTGYDDNDNEENEYIGPLTGETMDRFYPVEDISRHNENADSEDSAVHILDSPIEYNGPGMFTDGLFSVLLPLPPPAQPHQQPPPAAAVISTTTAFATSAIYHRPSISHSISDLKDGSDNTPIERRKTPMPPSRTRKGIYKPSEMEAKRLADLMIATTTAATSSSVSPVSGSSHSAASSVLLDSDEVLRLIMEKETPFYQRKNSFSGLLAGYSFAATPDADAAAPSVEENEEEEKDDDDDDIPLAHLSISTSRKSSIAPASCIPSPSASLSSPLSPSSHNISKQRKCSCLSNQSRATGCPSIKQQEDQMDTETLSDRDNHLLFESYFGDNNKACSSSSSGYIGHTRNFSLGAVRPRRKSTPFSSPSFMPISSSTTTTISSSPPALVHPMAETCWSPDVLADLEMIAAEQVLELKPFDILMQPQSQKLMMIENDDKHPQKSKLRLMSIFRKI